MAKSLRWIQHKFTNLSGIRVRVKLTWAFGQRKYWRFFGFFWHLFLMLVFWHIDDWWIDQHVLQTASFVVMDLATNRLRAATRNANAFWSFLRQHTYVRKGYKRIPWAWKLLPFVRQQPCIPWLLKSPTGQTGHGPSGWQHLQRSTAKSVAVNLLKSCPGCPVVYKNIERLRKSLYSSFRFLYWLVDSNKYCIRYRIY